MQFKSKILIAVWMILVSAVAVASDQIPGKPQESPILLSGGDVYTVSGEILRGAQVLLENGRITGVGKDIAAPAGTRRIDVAGKRIYPGLLAAGNDLGLTEIGSVRGPNDVEETGTVNPNARAEVAVNPDSELIPVARANGVLLNLTMPEGGLLLGSSAIIQLDGWTWEDMTVKAPAAMHVTWPSATPPRARRLGPEPEEQTSPTDERTKSLERAFANARAYQASKNAAAGASHLFEIDARWEAMLPLIDGKIPLVAHANDVRDIQAAVSFAVREKLKLIIHGGFEAPRCAELLKKHDVPVIVNGVQRLPLRADSPYDEPFTLPKRLADAGVRFCISQYSRHGSSDTRNLPYHAATAAAYGLSPDEALKAITIYPAQILGIGQRVGSIETGKDATLFVANGNILETPTMVELAFVQGREVDLSSRHTQLWKKYREKYERQKVNGKTLAAD